MPHEKDILPSVSGFQSCGSFMQQLLIPHFQIIVKKRIVYHAFKSRQQTDIFPDKTFNNNSTKSDGFGSLHKIRLL